MIIPKERQDAEAVAEHYNSLDPWYLKLWGEHIHHGLWKQGNESPEQAVLQLIDLVAEKASLKDSQCVCDIGCGYGATSRVLTDRWGAQVTAFTLSKKQQAYAQSKDPRSTYLLRDWLENKMPKESFDAAISIESSEHMVDKPKFFREIYRVLKPNGKVVVCAWLAKEDPKAWEEKILLEPICREGRLPSLGSAGEYLHMMQEAGFPTPHFEDLSAMVKKTWAICAWRVLKAFGNRDFRHFLFKQKAADRIFAKTVFRILLAYQTKSMVYGIFHAEKP